MKKSGIFSLIICTICFGLLLSLMILAFEGNTYFISIPEICGFGLSFKVDGFRTIMGTFASFMWFICAVFSIEYMKYEHNQARFYVFNIITLIATVAVFFAGDLFTLFLAFEIMSIASYVYVVQEETKEALKAAATYLAVAVIGGLTLLMGIMLLYKACNTLSIDELSNACKNASNYKLIVGAVVCMLIGFAAKAGMFPIHIWLPKAHPVAPAPASALLSGMLTKTGIFGIMIIAIYIMKGNEKFGNALLVFALITMLVGAIGALFSNQMKKTLACSSVSQIGFILAGVSMQVLLAGENVMAVNGTILYMFNHSTFKLLLFLFAGAIYLSTHNLDYNAIKGIYRGKVFYMIIYLVGALGISGIPFFSGYVSKTLVHESMVEYMHLGSGSGYGYLKLAEILFLFAGGLTLAYMLKLFVVVFVEKPNKEYSFKKISIISKIALALPAILIIVFGILPNDIFEKLAHFSKSFFGVEENLVVNYFTLENLKGSAISIAIGLVVYFIFVRPFMIRKAKKSESGENEYIDRWPKWLDLEDGIYRPLLLRFLPFIFSIVFRFFDRFIDGITGIIQIKALMPTVKRTPVPVGTRFSYSIGVFLDDMARFLNKTILRKKPIKRSFVKAVEIGRTQADRTRRLIMSSISFALLFFSLGLIFTLIYLLVVTIR